MTKVNTAELETKVTQLEQALEQANFVIASLENQRNSAMNNATNLEVQLRLMEKRLQESAAAQQATAGTA